MITWIAFFLLLPPTLYCCVCSLYLVGLLFAAVLGERATGSPISTPDQHVVVAIPAHNEEKLLGRTIQSVLQCDYPPKLLEVVVIADNCSDGTAQIAQQHGAQVLERNNPCLRGKGYALDFFINQYLASTTADAVAIVDADTTVSRNFLLTISSGVKSGLAAGQVRNTVENAHEGWRPAMQFISFALKDHVRALGRHALGCSGGLFGNGMFFSRKLLVERGWPATSIAEDVEFASGLVKGGMTIAYLSDATVNSDMPVANAEALDQKTRWETGQFRMAREFAVPLLTHAILRHSLDALLWGCDLLVAPLMLLFALACLLFVACLVGFEVTSTAIMAILALVSGATVMFLVLYAIGGLLRSRAPQCVWRSLLMLPAYALWKCALYLRMAIRGAPTEWIRTRR